MYITVFSLYTFKDSSGIIMITSSTIVSRMLRALVLGVLFMGFASSVGLAQGRVDAYVTTRFSGTLSSIAGTGTGLGYGDDGVYAFAAPFAFNYDGNTIAASSTMYIMDNGMCGIGASANGSYSTTTTGSSSYPNILCGCNSDLYHYRGNNYWVVTGTAPNRVLTMEETDVSGYGYSTESLNLQTIIYETTNVIEFWYNSYSYTTNGSDGCVCVTIGLNGGSTGGFKTLVYQASGTTTPTANLRFTPPPPPIISQLSVQPKVIAFGSLNSGQSATQCVTVKNTGPNGPLTFNSISITGNPDFTVVQQPAAPLIPGATDQICVRFSPIASGGRSATLTVTTNGQDSGTQTVTLTGTGIAPAISVPTTDLFKKTRTRIGDTLTQSFAVFSTGTGALTFNSISIFGTYASEYAVTRVAINPLPSGTWDTVTVQYRPTLEGSRPAVLVINSNALNKPLDTVGLFGVGTIGRLTVAPSPLNFDSVGVGDTACQFITLTNVGSDTVRILNNYFASFDADYTMVPLKGADTIIPPDKFKQIQICFAPIRNGARTARLRLTTTIPLTYDSPRKDTSTFVVNIIGTGVPFGKLAVAGTGIIDSAVVGKTVCRTDTFWNKGSADLTIKSATLAGSNASEFVLSGNIFPIVVPAGGFKVFTICATPGDRGDRNATLNIAATSNGRPLTASLSLDVFGQLVCASATPQAGFANKTCVGETDTAIFTVTNCGDVATSYNAAFSGAGAADYAVVGSANSPVISGGQNATFKVTYTPKTRGASVANLDVSATGVTPVTIAMNGVGGAANISGPNAQADSTFKGSKSNFTVVLTNNGECDWTPGQPVVTGAGFSWKSGGTTAIPAAGGTGQIVFEFAPTAVGQASGVATFSAQSNASIPVFASITLSGVGKDNLGVAPIAEANGFRLEQNYPNPFNPTTEIRFSLPKETMVTLAITDITGKTVRMLVNGKLSAGSHTVTLDASQLSSGTYYYELISGSTHLVKSMILSK
jgi:hypothetical protein